MNLYRIWDWFRDVFHRKRTDFVSEQWLREYGNSEENEYAKDR